MDIDRINAKAPYVVQQLDALSYMFSTKHGYHYLVGFSPDKSFVEDGAYQFYLVEKDHRRGPHDDDIFRTVTAIIEEFFRTAPGIMLYICDDSDSLHAVRNRLFAFWFSQYPDNNQYVLITENITIDAHTYYAGLIMAKSHPQLGEIIQSFHKFAQELPSKI